MNQPQSQEKGAQGRIDEEFSAVCEAAQDTVKLGRLRAYLRPILIQNAKNISQAAAHGISDFEAMKRGTERLRQIEEEEE